MENTETRRNNRAAILRLAFGRGQITRQELIDDTGLSKATVSRLVRDLVEESVLTEGPAISGAGGGRSTQVLEFRGDTGYTCGVDVGGSNTRFIVTDYRARLIKVWIEPTPREDKADALADWLTDQILSATPQQRIPVTTVGVPGAVSPQGGTISDAPNLPQIEDSAFSERLSARFDGNLRLENDSNAALLGELSAGAANGAQTAVMFTVGTGLGAGVFLDGELFTGAHGLVGEFGAIPLSPDGTTLEQVLSASGIVAAARLVRLRGTTPKSLLNGQTAPHDALRRRIASALYTAMVTVSVAYEPDIVVLGGGIAPSLMQLLPGVHSRLCDTVPAPPTLAASALGDFSGAIGALALSLESAYRLLGAAHGSIFDSSLRTDLTHLATEIHKGMSR